MWEPREFFGRSGLQSAAVAGTAAPRGVRLASNRSSARRTDEGGEKTLPRSASWFKPISFG